MDQENLLPFDTPSNNNNIQYSNNEDNNNENTLSFTKSVTGMIIYLIFFFSIVFTGLILLIIFKANSFVVLIYLFVFSFTGILTAMALSTTTREILFIKNTYLNQLTVKIKKACCCCSQYILMLENAYIYCEKWGEKGVKIFILNTLKNPREIDLDKSNIKTSPINLLYGSVIGGNYDETRVKIDNFLGERNFENNICDEINKYISLYNKNYEKDEKKLFDKYMKITDHFYTLFFDIKYNNKRTDFIYSNDFERLFIGKVNGSRYKKTLLLNLSEIDSFEMVEKGDDEMVYNYIQINYKNQQQTQIFVCSYNGYLAKFVLLLNGKLNEINAKKNEYNNNTPLY